MSALVPFSFFDDVIILNNETDYTIREIEYAFNNSTVFLTGIEENHQYIMGFFAGPSDFVHYQRRDRNLAVVFIAKYKRMIISKVINQDIEQILHAIRKQIMDNFII